tara:strand:+ start:53 stop:475 length:423 start_codon:yes stop_codon:yes gene_type:complete
MCNLGSQALSFRKAFNQECISTLSQNGSINQQLWDMQVDLINEESCEFLEAAEQLFADPENEELREQLLKELSDVVFVSYQFASAFGFDLDKAMSLVFDSNMTKLDKHGKPIYRDDGKVLKGPDYQPPDLQSCLPKSNLN